MFNITFNIGFHVVMIDSLFHNYYFSRFCKESLNSDGQQF